VRIAAEDPDSPSARLLLAELSAALQALTGDSGRSSFDPDDVRGPRAQFLVAYDAGNIPVACGAVRPLDEDRAEIKRMYARPGSRAGQLVLAALESYARSVGYSSAALSTRRVNERALAFYARHGYRETPPFGAYVTKPQSICLGKPL